MQTSHRGCYGSLGKKYAEYLNCCLRFECCNIFYTLRDLVPFAQFRKCKKSTHGVLLLVKLQTLKVTLLHGCFSCFLNCKNRTKLRKASYIIDYGMSNCVSRLSQCLNIDLIGIFIWESLISQYTGLQSQFRSSYYPFLAAVTKKRKNFEKIFVLNQAPERTQCANSRWQQQSDSTSFLINFNIIHFRIVLYFDQLLQETKSIWGN